MAQSTSRHLEPVLWIAALLVGTAIADTTSLPLLRIVAGLVVVLIAPGYLLLAVLWPSAKQPDYLWRLTMVLPAGIAIVGILLLLVNYFGTYSYGRVIWLIGLVDVALAAGASIRSVDPADSVLRLTLRIPPLVAQLRRVEWTHSRGLLVTMGLVFLGSVAYAVATPIPAARLTEFYLLSGGGELPLQGELVQGDEIHLTLGIANSEGRPMDYSVVVQADRGSATTVVWSDDMVVPDGQRVEFPLTLETPAADVEALDFHLFVDGEDEPYRSLRLPLPRRD